MAKDERVTARFDESEKVLLREVADRVCGGNRSQTIRILVLTAHEVLKEQDAKAKGKNQTCEQSAN